MIIEKKLLNKIKELGLNTYEAKIWTALLSRGVSTAGEISDIANVPRSRSYDVLESLEKKGFIIMKVGKPIQYIAVPPEEALERVKKGVREEAGKTIELLEEFEESQILRELTTLHNTGIEAVDPTEITGFVKGRTNILNQMKSMIKNAQKQIVVNTDSVSTFKNDVKGALKKAEKNNVSIQINSSLKGTFLVADSKKVMFSLTGNDVHPDYETHIWVESPALAETFSSVVPKTNLKVEVKKVVN